MKHPRLRLVRILGLLGISFMLAAPPWPVHSVVNPNLISNPSLEVAGVAGRPQDWFNNRIGTNTATFTYPVAGQSDAKAARIDMTSYTSGDAKWYFADVPVTAGKEYQLSNWYQSDVTTNWTLRYQKTDGTYIYQYLTSPPPSATWRQASMNIVIPGGITGLTLFHAMTSTGYLVVDSYRLEQLPGDPLFKEGMVSLNFDDSWKSIYDNARPILDRAKIDSTQYYITEYLKDPDADHFSAEEARRMKKKDHEIGAHTRTHPHLTTLTPDELKSEIDGSRKDLKKKDMSPTTFAYPYGEYNDAVVARVDQAGFRGARTTNGGFNYKTTNPFLLHSYSIRSTTSVDQMKAWIDTAVANRSWLIITFHEITNTPRDIYGTSPAVLQQVVDYLKAKKIKVVTNEKGLSKMAQKSSGDSDDDDSIISPSRSPDQLIPIDTVAEHAGHDHHASLADKFDR